MKKIIIALTSLIAVLAVNYFVFAVWNEPTQSPPNGNVPAPVNVGPDYQKKEGNLEVNNMTAASITLGGVTKTAWPVGGIGGVACTWEGTKCDCKDDETSTWTGSEIQSKITIGTTCTGGQITEVKIVNFQVSTGERNCQSTPPAACTPGLYTRN